MNDTDRVLVVLLIIISLALMTLDTYNDIIIEQAQYCELVQLWEDTNGENSHPDYKKVAADWCNDNHITE